MKFLCGVVVFLNCVVLSATAQTRQQQKTDSVYRLVKKAFNQKDVGAIYALTGQNFKNSVPLASFRSIAEQQLFPLGAIKRDTLLSFNNNKDATYKIQLDAIALKLLMNLDDKDKLELFLFQPYSALADNIKTGKVPTSNPLTTATDKIIDSIARVYIQKQNTAGLSLGVIRGGKVSVYNYGEATKGNNKLPDGNTIFELGSITKTFTSILLAWYVNQGKVSLNDPITKYLPTEVAANPQLKDIKLVNLSNHTSGLSSIPSNSGLQRPYDEANPYKNYSRQLLFDYLAKCTLIANPGEKYAYSNLASGVLGSILEKVSGKPYEQMVAEIITQPLGMKSTIQKIYPMLTPRVATVYDEEGNQTSPWDFDALASAGALRSSMNDMLLYVKANMNSKGISPLDKAINLTHQITLNNDARIGLSWHIIVVGGVDYYFHNGGTGGSSSFLAFNKEKQLGIVILSNAAESTDPIGVSLLRNLQQTK
ncbi:MAG: class A beta-lactamase-related serine hydrolase [Sphingobacteriaceae bacterium]|nr:MAG: class A beta-lactamase-related serine hydrolase [Sphingobacteriaceae bacterium]